MSDMKFDITKVIEGAIKEFQHQGYTVGLARCIHGSWTGEDLNGTKVKVLYWQPLPEPPETKKYNVLK